MKLKQKKNWEFGYRDYKVARLYLKRSYTNIFLTLTDLRDKVIVCKTSGSSGLKGSKRRKKAPIAVESIFSSLLEYLRLYNITKLEIVLKMRINAIVYILSKELEYYGIDVTRVMIRRKVAFNGVKGRKLRRL